MSIYHVTLTVQHDGKTLPGYPFVSHFEEATNEGKLLDNVFSTNDTQAPSGLSPMVAIVFDANALIEINTEIGLNTLRMAAESCVLIMASSVGLAFTPTPDTPVRGII